MALGARREASPGRGGANNPGGAVGPNSQTTGPQSSSREPLQIQQHQLRSASFIRSTNTRLSRSEPGASSKRIPRGVCPPRTLTPGQWSPRVVGGGGGLRPRQGGFLWLAAPPYHGSTWEDQTGCRLSRGATPYKMQAKVGWSQPSPLRAPDSKVC